MKIDTKRVRTPQFAAILKTTMMNQRLSVITIGADNFEKMRAFYSETLGWKSVAENKDICFYQMNGFLFSITGKKPLADFIGTDPAGSGFRPITIGYNLNSSEEVLEAYESLKNKVKILREPTEPPFGGLFFYFADIEGNILEIAFNPFVKLDESMNVVGHGSIDRI